MSFATELVRYVEELHVIAATWQQHRLTTSQQMQYLHSLLAVEELLAYPQPAAAAAYLVSEGVASQLMSTAVEHALLGCLPWITVEAWERTLDYLLRVTHSHMSYAQFVRPLWIKISSLVKDRQASSPTTVPSTCAGLSFLRLLLTYAPAELRPALRRYLPHPVKNASVAMRVQGYEAVPWVIANASTVAPATETRGSSSHPNVMLNAEFFEYLRKGVRSSDVSTRLAALRAVRHTLEIGVSVNAAQCQQLLAYLVATCQDGSRFISRAAGEDVGVIVGYLLAHCQVGFEHGRSFAARLREEGASAIHWEYCGGVTAIEAGRVTRKLFNPAMSRMMQHALSTALQTLFQLCVVPSTMAAALRSVFVLLIPIEGDRRNYMPRLVAHALTSWAAQMPLNSYRLELVLCLQNYMRCSNEEKSVRHTALLCISTIMPMLASSRDIANGLEKDLVDLLEAQPSLWITVSEVYTALIAQNPSMRTKLHSAFVRTAGASSFSRHLLFKVKTLIALLPQLEHPDVFLGPLLSMTLHLGSVEIPATMSDGALQVVESFFYLVRALMATFASRLTPFLTEKLNLSVTRFATLLVSSATPSPSFCRAACAACQYFRWQGPTSMQRALCIGLLEGLLLHPSPAPVPVGYGEAHLCRLKKDVYQVISKRPWPDCRDGVSLHWLLTRALDDVETAIGAGIVMTMSDADVFSESTAVYLQRTRSMTLAATEGLRGATLQQAVRLIGWGMRHFDRVDRTFCGDIIRRVDALTADPLGQSSSRLSATDPNGQRCRDWSTLCLIRELLECLCTAHPTTRKAWVEEFGDSLRAWEAFARRVVSTPVFDVRSLTSHVLAALAALMPGGVESLVTGMLRGTRNANLMLVAAEAHVLAHALDGAAAPTVPLMLSLVADELKKSPPLSNPCTMPAAMLLISCITLAKKYPAEVKSAIGLALMTALLMPEPVEVDPLVQNLLLVLFSFLPLTTGPVGSERTGLEDVLNTIIRQTVYRRQAACDLLEDCSRAALSLCYQLLQSNRRMTDLTSSHDANTYTVLLAHIQHQLMVSLAANSAGVVPETVRSGNEIARILPVVIPDPIAKGLAVLTVLGLNDADFSGHTPQQLTLSQLSILVDAASSAETRQAWWSVGEVLLRQATSSAKEMLAFMTEIHDLLLARPPDLTVSGMTASSPEGETGDAEGEGQQSMLPSSCRGGDAKGKGNEHKTPVPGDIASKVFTLHLVKQLIRLRLQEAPLRNSAVKLSLVAASLVEATPDLMGPAIEILLELLELFQGYQSLTDGSSTTLLEWKTQLAATVKSVVQLCVFNVQKGCDVTLAFMHSALADGGSMRRVVRGLTILLGSLDHMSLEASCSSTYPAVGLVVLTLGEVIRYSRSRNWQQTVAITAEALHSPAGQCALTMLCNRIITTVSIANGLEAPASLTPPGFIMEEGAEAHGDPSVVLAMIAEVCRGRREFGPGLRYAVGCLACIVIAAAEADLKPLPPVVAKLSTVHQRIIVETAHRTLMKNLSAPTDVQFVLLDIIAKAVASAKSPKMVRNLEMALLSPSQRMEALTAVQVVDLLMILLQGGGSLSAILNLLKRLHVDYVCATPDALVTATRAYIRGYRSDAARVHATMGVSSPCGLVLSERVSALDSDLSNRLQSLLNANPLCQEVIVRLVECLQESDDPATLLQRVCHPGAPLNHIGVLVSTMGAVTDATLYIKCSPALCVLLQRMMSGDVASATIQESLRVALLTLSALLVDAPQAAIAKIVLKPVAIYVMQVVAKRTPAELRWAIKEVGPDRGACLRRFMEQSMAV